MSVTLHGGGGVSLPSLLHAGILSGLNGGVCVVFYCKKKFLLFWVLFIPLVFHYFILGFQGNNARAFTDAYELHL